MQPRTWTKRDGGQGVTYQFVGETQTGQYDKTIHFQVFGQDKFTAMQLVEGGIYQVSFDIESRAWKDTYITSVIAWKATRTDNAMQQPTQQAAQNQAYAPNPTPQYAPQPAYQPQQPNDDIPF